MKKIGTILITLFLFACSNNPAANQKQQFIPHHEGVWYIDAPHHAIYIGNQNKLGSYARYQIQESPDTFKVTSPLDSKITIQPEVGPEGLWNFTILWKMAFNQDTIKKAFNYAYGLTIISPPTIRYPMPENYNRIVAWYGGVFEYKPTVDTLRINLNGSYNPSKTDSSISIVEWEMRDSTRSFDHIFEIDFRNGLIQTLQQIMN